MTHVRLYDDGTHKAVRVEYDAVEGEFIFVRAENTETGDIGTKRALNELIRVVDDDGKEKFVGRVTLYYPLDFDGEDEVVVDGSVSGQSKGKIRIGGEAGPDLLIP